MTRFGTGRLNSKDDDIGDGLDIKDGDDDDATGSDMSLSSTSGLKGSVKSMSPTVRLSILVALTLIVGGRPRDKRSTATRCN